MRDHGIRGKHTLSISSACKSHSESKFADSLFLAKVLRSLSSEQLFSFNCVYVGGGDHAGQNRLQRSREFSTAQDFRQCKVGSRCFPDRIIGKRAGQQAGGFGRKSNTGDSDDERDDHDATSENGSMRISTASTRRGSSSGIVK